MSTPAPAPNASAAQGRSCHGRHDFPENAVRIERPYTKHQHRPGEPNRSRAFCPGCGTGKFFSSGAGFPGTIAITGGTFADPGFPPPEFILYWANCPQWSGVPEGITLHLKND